jgi:signal peptidase I
MSINPSPPAPARPVIFEGPIHPPKAHAKHGPREAIETVVFVTVLVLLLKSFVAEAFVIPTGSMAETLLGYRRFVTCPSCGHVYPVNCSEEVDPQRGGPVVVEGSTCPNCRFHDEWRQNGQWVKQPPAWGSGDRVLVAKWPLQKYLRWDVVVFKYPREPQQNWVPMNYIKRLTGLPGDTIAINNGDLFVARDIDYRDQEQPARELDRWWRTYMYPNASAAQEAFKAGKFEILRKPPAQMLAMRRLVFDNSHQPQDIKGDVPPRWQAAPGWTTTDHQTFTRAADSTEDSWVRYQHLVVGHGGGQPRPAPPFQPEFIRNFMGYNFGDTPRIDRSHEDRHWVGDLMVECNVDVATASGEFALELSKGPDRFQARFELATGNCRLVRVGRVTTTDLATASTALRGPGKRFVRFANFDNRLTVWVDRALPFGDGVDYTGDINVRADEVNDKQPASAGAVGPARLTVSGLKLYRDTYYTAGAGERLKGAGEPDLTLYVQPGHYLCMGDNSTQSSDGRDWGAVPERLMLGKAKMVYFPVWPLAPRFGPIR